MGKKSRAKRDKENVAERSEVAKTKKKKEGLFSQYSLNKLVLVEDIALAVLFFSVALVFTTKIQVHFTLPKLAALRISSFFIVLIWIYRIKIGEIKAIPKPVLFTGIALGLWWIFTTFFAVHVPTAIHGVYGRYNALLNHEIYLLLFFIMATIPMDAKRVERILKIFVAAFVPVALYAIIQFYGFDPFPWPIGRSASTIGNPVILGAVLSLTFPFIVVLLFVTKSNAVRIYWGVIAALFLVGIITTLSRGPFAAIIVSFIIIFMMNLRKFKTYFKKIIIFIIPLVVLAFVFAAFSHGGMAKITNRIKTISDIKTDVNILARLVYYKAAINGIKDYPILGVGFENYRIVYPKYRLFEDNIYHKDTIPTMVHNGYIQTALTNGIPALVLYMVLVLFVFVFLIKAFRRTQNIDMRFLYSGFVASIAGHLIQDLTGWLEIALTPLFWTILGLSVALSSIENQKMNLAGWKKPTGYAFGALCGIALIFLSVDAINRINADRLFWKSQMLSPTKDWPQIESNIKEGLEFMPDDFYYYDMAGLLYIKRLNETGDAGAYKKGVAILEKAHRMNPFDIYIFIHRMDIDSIALKKGIISKPSEFVEQSVNKLMSMDKNNPTIYESIVKLKLGEKKYKDALEYLKKAMALRPDDATYLLMQGEIYYASGDTTSSMNVYRSIVARTEKISPPPTEWTKAKYGIAHCLFNKRDFDSALKEMKTVTDRLPKDAHAYVIMGDAYGGMGNLEKAKESFATALKFDPNNPFAKRGYEQIDKILGKEY
ncbi:MAG: O-antigen ligase family protein [Proteobacteria bacterium]|nr:O-antigen ligase family protein [Pseudomonadota bacterium]